jgi:hypothetical protein
MKKIGIFLGLVTMVMLTSCRKDWTCKCTDESSNDTFHVVPDATLNDAENTCNGYEYNNNLGYNNCSIVP